MRSRTMYTFYPSTRIHLLFLVLLNGLPYSILCSSSYLEQGSFYTGSLFCRFIRRERFYPRYLYIYIYAYKCIFERKQWIRKEREWSGSFFYECIYAYVYLMVIYIHTWVFSRISLWTLSVRLERILIHACFLSVFFFLFRFHECGYLKCSLRAYL